MADRPDTRQIYSVGELAETLRGMLESALPAVWVQGEVSNFRNPSGHWYFTLKDARAQVRCAMFRGRNARVPAEPRDGDAVLVRGAVTFYTVRGDLQIVVDHLEPAGEGALLRAFEELKRRLAAEGLFDESLKRPLPALPRCIGIITSATGAALHDILTTLRRRYPLGRVAVLPVPVQGDAAPPAIVGALQVLPAREPVDVILLARGGGSLEDLWAFNDERVARAIRSCPVPVVTGVGHETDFTIADFAADLRAPTPTGAAERIAPDRGTLLAGVERLEAALAREQQGHLDALAEGLLQLRGRLDRVHPGRQLGQLHQRLDELSARIAHAGPASLARRADSLRHLGLRLRGAAPAWQVARKREGVSVLAERMRAGFANRLATLSERVAARTALLQSLGPQSVLDRGYAIVQDAAGDVIRDSARLSPGDTVEIALAKGGLTGEVRRTR